MANSGGVDSKHPQWLSRRDDWVQMRDTYEGERRIKDEGEAYLPATAAMTFDGMHNASQKGYRDYQAYKVRANFPDLVAEAVEGMVGVMHREPARIELPKRLEAMLEKATPKGEPLHNLLRKINEQQLVSGRIGLLLDAPMNKAVSEALPMLVSYHTLRIINWDNGKVEDGEQALNFLVLDESEYEREGFGWELASKFRVLRLNPESGVPEGTLILDNVSGSLPDDGWITPQIAGRTPESLPFVFINAQDLIPEPDKPPLLGLSDLALTVYRGDADYRQALFMQGQETLVVIGEVVSADPDAEDVQGRVGAGARLDLPLSGDAKYVGVSAAGLSEMRQARENDLAMAQQKGSRLLDTEGSGQQSGEALRIRVAASTATLHAIALTGAAGLSMALKMAARWVGANPDEVVVEPNLDFSADEMSGKDLLELVAAKSAGAPISLQSIHRQMQKRDLTDLTLEEELAEIAQEEPINPAEEDMAGAPVEDDPGTGAEEEESQNG